MMRQNPNSGQSFGSSPGEQKKSVFDRLGRPVEIGGHRSGASAGNAMKRRPSPGQYGEYMQPPPPMQMHEGGEFNNRYPRDGPINQAELDWRYQNRSHLSPFLRDRHSNMHQQAPVPPNHMQPMPPPPQHYEMEVNHRQQGPYYPHLGFHNGANGPPPHPGMISANELPMAMHQQQSRSSPKYDRHGNVITGFKDRGLVPPQMRMNPMEHALPSRGFIPPMMHPGPPPLAQPQQHEMPPMRPGMYGPRWQEGIDPEFSPGMHEARLMQDQRFSPGSSRFQQQQMMRQQQNVLPNQQQQHAPPGAFINMPHDIPRYTKWKERRDVITTLDRETAQSSSRTDSLKSTLQQIDNKSASSGDKQQQAIAPAKKEAPARTSSSSNIKTKLATAGNPEKIKDNANSSATEPQEISDGEIIDDEDSSDDCESSMTNPRESSFRKQSGSLNPTDSINYKSSRDSRSAFIGNRESHQKPYEPSGKKRRIHEREDYSTMDYETISDDDLDVYMVDKKDGNVDERKGGKSGANKSLSEIELLNALGLDWANLVEMARQSKSSSSKDVTSSGAALSRFSMPNYLPTLGITPDLAGQEIYELITRVCRA